VACVIGQDKVSVVQRLLRKINKLTVRFPAVLRDS